MPPTVHPLNIAPATPPGQNVWGGTTFQAASRFLVSIYFFLSAVGKVQAFDKETGGPYMNSFGPKLDMFLFGFKDMTGLSIPINKVLLALAVSEFLGGLLFASDQRFGAWLLVMVTFVQSIILHNFWDYANDPATLQNEMHHFHKNLALIGALLHYLATCPGTKHKNKFQRTMDAVRAQGGEQAITSGPRPAATTPTPSTAPTPAAESSAPAKKDN